MANRLRRAVGDGSSRASTVHRDELRIVVPRYGPSVVGGAESAMRGLALALAARGWAVQVWTTTAVDEATWSVGFAPGIERDGDIEVRRFPVVSGRRPWLFRQLSRVVYHLPHPRAAEQLWAVVQGPYAPGLTHALKAARPMPTLFSPYLFHPTLVGVLAAPHPRILCPAAHDEPAMRLAIVDRAVMAADALWFYSEEERDLLLRAHPSAAGTPARCGVVGVDPPANVDPSSFAARRGIRGPYLYYGGRVARGKGFEGVLSGAALLHQRRPEVRLVLSGDASNAPDAPWMYHAGMLNGADRWAAIAGAAAVVVPGELESLSLLALEAWAVGRPCLLNRRSAVLEGHARRSGGGLTFSGPDEFAERAAALVDDPAKAAEMGARGHAYVVHTYRWDLAERRLRELLEVAST
ncbi:MAG TPA: glycosyltransferase family 4 protein [Candidatus Dormibacteraeota bacterium]|nr:glycosyltransferase family 4 protein [Candidatus Dormibacteraeota bacterium]